MSSHCLNKLRETAIQHGIVQRAAVRMFGETGPIPTNNVYPLSFPNPANSTVLPYPGEVVSRLIHADLIGKRYVASNSGRAVGSGKTAEPPDDWTVVQGASTRNHS